MNEYTTALSKLKKICESDTLVHTVTRGEMSGVDLEDRNIFPLVHIDIEAVTFNNGQTLTFSCVISALSDRLMNYDNTTELEKFWRADNEVDNHNECLHILNRIWLTIYRDFNGDNWSTSNPSPLEKITFEHGNVLDGWQMNFELEVANKTTACE